MTKREAVRLVMGITKLLCKGERVYALRGDGRESRIRAAMVGDDEDGVVVRFFWYDEDHQTRLSSIGDWRPYPPFTHYAVVRETGNNGTIIRMCFWRDDAMALRLIDETCDDKEKTQIRMVLDCVTTQLQKRSKS